MCVFLSVLVYLKNMYIISIIFISILFSEIFWIYLIVKYWELIEIKVNLNYNLYYIC